MRKDHPVINPEAGSFTVQANPILFQPATNQMFFANADDQNDNDLIAQALPILPVHGSATVRCMKNIDSKELEWYLDGDLVTTRWIPNLTDPSPDHALWCTTEMIPCVLVAAEEGSCRITHIELEM